MQLILALMRVLLRPYAFDARSRACVPPSVEVIGDLADRLKPFAVFIQDKLSLSYLIAYGKPSISNIVIGPKQLDPLSSKTEPLDDIVDL